MATAPAPDAPTKGAGLDRALLLVATAVVLGAFMAILDITVVSVALNTLASDFKTDLPTIQWIITGYTLALATVVPLTGWGADRFGTKRLYMLSIVLFAGGSILSGLAWNVETLIFFRILQGFGGGMLMPLGMTILTRAAGPQRVGRVMAIIGVPMLIAPIAGPVLGGWLVDSYSWRWIFFINAPVGILAFIVALRVLPRDVPAPQNRFDWIGLVLLSPGLALLIYGLAQTNRPGGFGRTDSYIPIVIGAVMIALFIWHGLRNSHALIDLRLFKNKVFTAATGTLALVVIAMYGGMLLFPQYLQVLRGESPMDAGLLLAPQGVGAMISMPIAGKLTDRTGIGKIVPVGLLLVGASYLALTQIQADTSYWWFGVVLFVMGMGIGTTMMPTFSGAMQTLRRASIASASTTLNIVQQTAASFGTAVLAVLLAHALASRLGGSGGGGGGLGVGHLTDEQRVQIGPAMADAFGATFWWAVGFVAVAIIVALVFLPKQLPEPVEDEEAGDDVSVAASMPMG